MFGDKASRLIRKIISSDHARGCKQTVRGVVKSKGLQEWETLQTLTA